MTTERGMRCSFRHLDGLLAKSDSRNCTEVVTTTGASQFSVTSSSRDFSSSSKSILRTTPEWFSKYDFFAEDAAIFGCVLLDDGEIGNDDNDAAKTVGFGVGQSKCHRSKRLAAARRYGEGEETGRQRGPLNGGVEDAVAKNSQRAAGVCFGFAAALRVDLFQQLPCLQNSVGKRSLWLAGSIEAVSINET